MRLAALLLLLAALPATAQHEHTFVPAAPARPDQPVLVAVLAADLPPEAWAEGIPTAQTLEPALTSAGVPLGAGQRLGLVAGGIAGGALLVAAALPLAHSEQGLALAAAVLPIGTAAGVYLMGRAAGADGRYVHALEGAAVGALAGALGATAVVLVGRPVVDALGLRPESYEWFSAADVALGVAAAGVLLGTTSALSARRYAGGRLRPGFAYAPAPGGEWMPTARVALAL